MSIHGADVETINLKGVRYAEKKWAKYFNNGRKLGNGLLFKLTKYGFFDLTEPHERLRVALDVLETYTISTAEKYFAHLKYGGYIQVPNIKTLCLAREYYGRVARRAPQARIPSMEQLLNFFNYLQQQFHLRRHKKMSTNIIKYDKLFGFIIMVLFVCNTGLRLSEALRVTTKQLRELLEGKKNIELKMKTSTEWNVVPHEGLYTLLLQMKHIYSDYLELQADMDLFLFQKTYIKEQIKKFFRMANNNEEPPIGFGLHTIRYYIASQAAKTNLKYAQMILNHKHISTTASYVRFNNLKLQESLGQLENISPLILDAKHQIKNI